MADHVARLAGGSLLTESDILTMSAELGELYAQLSRARSLAAKLEEVVAMRTAVLAALVAWGRGDSWRDQVAIDGIVDWARGQLEEVP